MINKKEAIYLRNNIQTIKINEELSVEINIESNKYNIPIDKLFGMATRNNTKRRFLFVSKVLGKHFPVNPKRSLLIGYMLSIEYLKKVYNIKYQNERFLSESISNDDNINEAYKYSLNNKLKLPEKTVFLGFAETATALGHSVFNSFIENAEYIHTTRENIIENKFTIKFQEGHSHAIDHRVYADESDYFKKEMPIILVDDEITTGNTNINIIRQIHKKFPKSKYVLMSILDWRSKNDIEKFKNLEKELGVSIISVSLIKGSINVYDRMKSKIIDINNDLRNYTEAIEINKMYINSEAKKLTLSSKSKNGKINNYPYLKHTGRFGISFSENNEISKVLIEIGELLKDKRKGGPTLCLGTGEFMYIPMIISANMGESIYYYSTTRSPIIPDTNCEKYAIKSTYLFDGIEDIQDKNYLYNLTMNRYDEAFIFFEREIDNLVYKQLISIFKNTKIKTLNIVVFSKCSVGGNFIDVKSF
ncbi:MAG: phosphoribosyltransferase family protein [Clostridiales bacterium]